MSKCFNYLELARPAEIIQERYIMVQKKGKIPQKIALELCKEIRKRNQKKHWFFGIGKMQCHFCWRFGQKAYNAGDPTKLCAFGSVNNRGCWQVNKLYDEQLSDDDSNYLSEDIPVTSKSKGYRFPIGFESLKKDLD
jgi:hypothetical protein